MTETTRAAMPTAPFHAIVKYESRNAEATRSARSLIASGCSDTT